LFQNDPNACDMTWAFDGNQDFVRAEGDVELPFPLMTKV
jgi:hypothetical protein